MLFFEGCKFIYNVQTLEKRTLLQDNDIRLMKDIIGMKWYNKRIDDNLYPLKRMCIDIIRIPLGKKEEITELERQVNKQYAKNKLLLQQGNDLNQSFANH